MKTKIKHNLVIFERESDWEIVREKIKKDFGATICAISWRLKRELGFTIRYHRAEIEGVTYSHELVHLDFFNESSHSWFVLKYLNLE